MPRRHLYSFVFFLLFSATGLPAIASEVVWGKVVDDRGQGLSQASVVCGGQRALTDADGDFLILAAGDTLVVKRSGYLAARTPLAADATVVLEPFMPRALYLSFYGAGHRGIRGRALDLIERTELNAVVIDVKGDRGRLSYPSAIMQAHDIGAQSEITLPNIRTLLADFKQRGIYTIARIVVFKDNQLAEAYPQYAVTDRSGKPWKDREGLGWVDPHQVAVQDYNLRIAEEAALLGFDEVQFDYVRFPDTARLSFSRPNSFENRSGAINDFLRRAKTLLDGYGTYLSADVFGYVCWNENDTFIGQHLETLLPHVDYMAPMLYPSGFSHGLPGYPSPMDAPYEIIQLSLQQALQRTNADPLRFRPWLQAFRDYAFDRRPFAAREISAQIQAARDSGSNGYMLWNAANRYSDAGVPVEASRVADQAGVETHARSEDSEASGT